MPGTLASSKGYGRINGCGKGRFGSKANGRSNMGDGEFRLCGCLIGLLVLFSIERGISVCFSISIGS